jgi:uncharacterized RDD family membrane protein YckC
MPCLNHPAIDDGLVVCWRCRRYFCPNCVAQLQNYYFCGECKTTQARDLLAGTDLLHLPYASLGRRFLAAFIDGVVKTGIGMIINMVFQFGMVAISAGMGGKNGAPELVVGLLGVNIVVQWGLQLLYEGGMTVWFDGQTLGKMALNMKVVNVNGAPLTAAQGWGRGVVKGLLHGCCCCFWFPDALLALGDERASLHDLMVRTRVVDAS